MDHSPVGTGEDTTVTDSARDTSTQAVAAPGKDRRCRIGAASATSSARASAATSRRHGFWELRETRWSVEARVALRPSGTCARCVRWVLEREIGDGSSVCRERVRREGSIEMERTTGMWSGRERYVVFTK